MLLFESLSYCAPISKLYQQPGELRTADWIQNEISQQFRIAAEGVAKHLWDRQTATGVKDKVALHWMELLLSKHREMRIQVPGRLRGSIADELLQWLDAQPGCKINPLLTMPGKS